MMTSRRSGRTSTWTSRRWPRIRVRPLIVLGIDPGSVTTGYGVVESAPGARYSLRECGVIRTRGRATVPERLHDIYEGVCGLMGRHAPDALAIEDVFYARNVRTTVVLGQARGVVLLAAQQRGIAIHEYPPAEIKKAIAGTGTATKDQIQFMIARMLRLKSAPEPSDAADGVAAALACAMGARVAKLIAELPEAPRAAPAPPRIHRRP